MTILFGSEFAESYIGWEAKQNDQGAIYYVNNELRITSWTHPYVDQILDKLDESFGLIKYAAYRTALKLRALQTQTGMVWINAKAVQQVMLSTSPPEIFEEGIPHGQALFLIDKILQLSEDAQDHEEEIPLASEIILNFIVSLYDLDHSGKVSYGSLVIALSALCSTNIMDKYKNFFACLKGQQNCMKKATLSKLISDLTQITDTIHESEAFGCNIKAAVKSCFKIAGTQTTGWISEQRFYFWLLQEPQTLIWLPTLHRIQATETSVHDIRCCVCLEIPIKGFRYRCLYCFKYDQCQNCFLKGLTSQGHKVRHPMTEYCLPTSTKDNTKAIFNILKNKLRRNQSQTKPSYLPVEEDSFSSINIDEQTDNVQQACNTQSSDSGLANSSDLCQGFSLSDKGVGFCNQGFEDTRVDDETDIVKISSPLSLISSEEQESPSELINKMSDRIKKLEQENRQLHKKLKCLQTKFELDSAIYEEYLDNTLLADDGKYPENMVPNLSKNQISSTLIDSSLDDKSDLTSGQETRHQTKSQEQSSAAEITNDRCLSVATCIKQGQSETEVSNGLLYQTCDMSLNIEEAKIKNNTLDFSPKAEQSEEIQDISDSSKCVTSFQTPSCEIHFIKETRPHLIYSLASSKVCKRERISLKTQKSRDKENSPSTETTTTSEDNICIELSNIYPASFGVTPSFSHHRNLNSVQCTPGQSVGRRQTMEPVYMSTPLVHPPAGQIEIQENSRTLLTQRHLQCPKASPLSAIPHWHRKRILLSCNSFGQGNNASGSQTCDSTGQFSKLLEKADRIGDMINQGQSFLTTEDQECYERMLQEFEKECLLDLTSNKFQMDADDAEMLQAVFTIEEAMKDLVQATGHHPVH